MGELEEVAAKLCAFTGSDVTQVRGFVQDGPPQSKGRARYSRKNKRFYTPGATESAEGEVAMLFRALTGSVIMEGNIALMAIFYRPNFQRIDGDNLLKLVMDAGTKGQAWKDDCQVTTQITVVEYDPEQPRTIVVWVPLIGVSLDRITPIVNCETCGRDMVFGVDWTNRRAPRRFCSSACREEARRRKMGAKCAWCQKDFERGTTSQRYCSRQCFAASKRGVPRGGKTQPPPCVDCGKPVSKAGYLRCRQCWKSAPRVKY